MYTRLPTSQKKLLIKRYKNGESIAALCREAKISRTIFYRWVKEYSQTENPLRKATHRKHWRKLDSNISRKVVYSSLKYPELSAMSLSRKLHISVGSVWNILNKYTITTVESRRNYVSKQGMRIRKTISLNDKLRILQRIAAGESLVKISKEENVSRTIIYNWISNVATKQGNAYTALASKRPYREAHWRYIKGAEKAVLEIIAIHPEYSLPDLSTALTRLTTTIRMSATGIYYRLKRINLNTYQKRFAYARLRLSISIRNVEVTDAFYPTMTKYSYHSFLSPPVDMVESTPQTSIKNTITEQRTSDQKSYQRSMNVYQGMLSTIVTFFILLSCMTVYKGTSLPQSSDKALIGQAALFVQEHMYAYSDAGQALHNGNSEVTQYLSRLQRENIKAEKDKYRENNLAITEKERYTHMVFPRDVSYKELYASGTINSNKEKFIRDSIAINTDKAIYSRGEEAVFAISIIDKQGVTVCDADVVLNVGIPGNNKTSQVLSSENGLVALNPECQNGNTTYEADYTANIELNVQEGIYPVSVEVMTSEGRVSLTDTLVIKNNPSFIVKRQLYPTRIYPKSFYPVKIAVKPAQTGSGIVQEFVPEGITIAAISEGGTVSRGKHGEQVISWSKEWQQNETYELAYELQFPLVSPEFYHLGSLAVYTTQGERIFTENRMWQVVSDSL